jgi:hypothetical protein
MDMYRSVTRVLQGYHKGVISIAGKVRHDGGEKRWPTERGGECSEHKREYG